MNLSKVYFNSWVQPGQLPINLEKKVSRYEIGARVVQSAAYAAVVYSCSKVMASALLTNLSSNTRILTLGFCRILLLSPYIHYYGRKFFRGVEEGPQTHKIAFQAMVVQSLFLAFLAKPLYALGSLSLFLTVPYALSRMLPKEGPKVDEEVLRKLISKGDLEGTKSFIKNIDIKNFRFVDLKTCLHEAVYSNHESLVELFLIPELINVEDYMGSTPLRLAWNLGYYSLIAKLLENGANPNHISAKKYPSHLSRAILLDELSMAKLFLKHGADPFLSISPHNSAFVNAFKLLKTEQLKEFLNSVDLKKTNAKGQTALYIAVEEDNKDAMTELLYYSSISLDHTDDMGNTIVHHAVKHGAINCLKLYLIKRNKYSKSFDFRNKNWETPLHLAFKREKDEKFDLEKITNIVKILLEDKASFPDVFNNNLDTIVHFAVKSGNLALVKLALDTSSLISTSNRNSLTPLGLAQKLGYEEIAVELVKRGAVTY